MQDVALQRAGTGCQLQGNASCWPVPKDEVLHTDPPVLAPSYWPPRTTATVSLNRFAGHPPPHPRPSTSPAHHPLRSHRSFLLVVVRHLQTRPLEATLDIEALVRLRAVENGLVAADVLRDKVERLDDPQPELLALLVLCDSDVFDMADEPEVVDATGVRNAKQSADRSLDSSLALLKRVVSKLTTSSPQATLLFLRPCPRRLG